MGQHDSFIASQDYKCSSWANTVVSAQSDQREPRCIAGQPDFGIYFWKGDIYIRNRRPARPRINLRISFIFHLSKDPTVVLMLMTGYLTAGRRPLLGSPYLFHLVFHGIHAGLFVYGW